MPGRENVQNVTIDMSDPYRTFVRRFFPNATIVVDRFHVQPLLSPAIDRHRKAITGIGGPTRSDASCSAMAVTSTLAHAGRCVSG